MAAPAISAINRSNGAQSLNTGDGPQNNNHGEGLQFNHSTLNFGLNGSTTDEASRLEKEKEDCLRSLSFESMDARQEDIALAHDQTCDWFFKTSQFQQWHRRDNLQNHNGVLWIKGHPGTGKSTLMKHTLRHLEREFSETHIIAAHFFNARGDYSERTALGMLRSILYQLLEKEPPIYEQFVPLFRNKNRKFKTNWNWRESDLGNFLFLAIQHCRSKSLIVLVDALDECDETHTRDVVGLLETLSIKAAGMGVALNICLSSRYYPHISIKKHMEFALQDEDEHKEDIVKYTRDKLAIRDKEIEGELLEKASGVFIWAVLVIGLLNKAYDDGQIEAMHETLHKVPSDLERVFETLLIKNNSHKQETAFMLQFVLLARRLIRPEELYFATIAKTTENIQAWDQSKIRPDDIRRRITNSSRGLIEVRKGKVNTVQFIHKSVNDFLIRNKRLQKLDPDLEVNGIGNGHTRLRSCCMRYIMMIPFQSAMNRKQIKSLASSYPFLEYASVYLLEHAEEANKQQIEQAEFLQCLIEEPSLLEKIRLLHNAFERYPGSGCIRGVSLLYMLAFHGYTRLAKALLDTKADANAQGGFYGNALQAAIAKDGYDIVRLLLDKGADFNAQGGYYGNALQAAIAKKGYDIARLLLDKGADFNAQGGIYGNALHAAAARGSEEILKLLLQKGVDVNTQGVRYGSALHAAAEINEREAAKFLLEEGANVNAQGGYFGHALQAAAIYSNKELVELLLEKGANVNAQGGFYGYALHAAAAEASEEIVELLLKEGADVNAQGGPYGNALCAAVIEGRTDTVQLLLENGADVNSPTEIYGNALQAATLQKDEATMRLLFERGANTNPPKSYSNAGLQTAIMPDTEGQLLEMILKQRTPVSADTQKALQVFCFRRTQRSNKFEETMKILLQGDIEPHNQWIYNFFCLHVMTINEQDAAKLVEKGATPNVCMQGMLIGLPAAVFYGQEELAAMLLDNGADINGPLYYTEMEAEARNLESHTYQYIAWLVLGMFSTLLLILSSYCFAEIF